MPLEPEVLVPRFGESLVAQGKISPEQLESALRYQKAQLELGRHLRLGRALIELGYVDERGLDEAITLQILQLQEALHRSNRELEKRVEQRTQELRNALLQISRLNQIKANFIANVSHELRTPLTLLMGYLDMMKEGAFGEVSREQAQALDTLWRAAVRLQKLIEDLILFAYAERGELTLVPGPQHLDKIVLQVLQRHQHAAKTKEISLQTKITTPLPRVYCDGERVAWAIDELITNALKFNVPGGWVSLEVTHQKGIVTVRVRDSGVGIPAQRLAEIFEPFHQLDSSSRRRYGGTGLGLALVKRILEAHSSHLRVESEVGKGSSFEFSLPTADEDTEHGTS
ncbi:MAG: ATP-binding protein [Anaerolineales bacterium]|nr:HAMP domain-containing histidine kinase [Anaerolineales bacterium]MCS7247295.1 HAMP domain-containing histidine kinase [Anaerolineales bacterium]MDW8161106.1 ATP-binding protein [Anaerolineales bacterium]MDW8446257.1 ATP-binding protein [Anaerolineales bacterium]